MSFTLFCYCADHVEIGSDGGHRLFFDVVSRPSGRRIVVSHAIWNDGRQPPEGPKLLDEAYRYASVCARNFGLA